MDIPDSVRIRVSGIIIEDNSILLIAHKKDGQVYWLLPGGGLEFGESLEEALKREFHEELNIQIKLNSLAMVCDSIDPEGERHILNICFNCSYESGYYRLGSDKRLHNYSFFTIDELEEISMYPPINEALKSIMKKENKEIYLGKIWLEKSIQ